MARKIVLGIGGSSGSIYAKLLMDVLAASQDQWQSVGVIMSTNALVNWRLELGEPNMDSYPFQFYNKDDFYAPFASGSAQYDTMIICPSSMGLIGRIASGMSDDLMTRAADVILKERRKLIIVPRETPWSLIHLKNAITLTEAGAIIAPASPSFYSSPQTSEQIAHTVVHRILDLADLSPQTTYRWGASTS